MPIPEYKAPENMTDDELLADLEKHHTPTEIPPCPVCGAELSIGSCGGGEPTVWACSSKEARPGSPDWMDHYRQTKFSDRRHDDPAVLELVKRYRLFVQSGETVRILEDTGERAVEICPGCEEHVDPEEPIPTVSKYGHTWHSGCAIEAASALKYAGHFAEEEFDRQHGG